MKDTWYITTPIYYSNDVPHIGHAYTTVAADFLSRWHRLQGRRVHFLTGTDEHGSKLAQAAEDKGLTPQEWVDTMAPRWKQLWQRLDITNDDFIRTTESRHKEPVARFMTELYEKGDIYLGTYEGLYCVRCEEFKTPTEAANGLCPVHGSPLEQLSEENYFFRLSAYNQALIDHYTANPGAISPERARSEVLGRLRDGLRDIPISRATVSWGIPLPWDQAHVIYVWIEALQNYITAVGYGSDEERFGAVWPADVHLIGKEIVWHHAIVWPAMLLAAGLELPRCVFAHGWLLAGGEKISKSGKAITQISPDELVSQFGVDGYRYHFLRAVTFGDDGNFSLEDMHARYNADLANDIGNLASRTVAMVSRYFDGVVPGAAAAEGPEAGLLEVARSAVVNADALVAEMRITEAIAVVWEIVRHANRYLVEREPWKLARDEANLPLVGAILNTVAESLARGAALLWPAMPGAMSELWSRLGYEGEPVLEAPPAEGNRVRTADPLFPRLEDASV
ncbi:MAG TPA: methionine--tRNA ligase [Actinomycetota bacterium]|nr:methionine--tRNA ligase [Actinomycetota bacterium]